MMPNSTRKLVQALIREHRLVRDAGVPAGGSGGSAAEVPQNVHGVSRAGVRRVGQIAGAITGSAASHGGCRSNPISGPSDCQMRA